MKSFVCLLALVFCNANSATAQIFEVDQISTYSEIFSGKIGASSDITLCLNHYQTSDYSGNIYSVKGWYYYDKFKVKIPIIGIYDGDLTLFVMKDPTLTNIILTGLSDWETIENLKNSILYEERIVIPYNEEKTAGTWNNASKSLPIVIQTRSLNVKSEQEFLRITHNFEPHDINLNSLGLNIENVELLADAKVDIGYRVLLTYESMSNDNVNGLCGAGAEAGYVQLTLSETFAIIDVKEIQTESCLQNFGIEDSTEISLEITKLKISEDMDGSKPFFVTIDKQNATLTWSE
jgi:hypothetical protein